MNKQTKALKMAIEFIEMHLTTNDRTFIERTATLQACKEALEQPAQEPVAYIKEVGGYGIIDFAHLDEEGAYPVYTNPTPSWQGLSDDEIDGVWFEVVKENNFEGTGKYFARAIEQALREKNHG